MDSVVQSRQNISDFQGAIARKPGPERLQKVQAYSVPRLLGAFVDVLARVDDALFDFVQKPGNVRDPQQYLGAMRELRRARAAIETRFGTYLEGVFQALAAGETRLAEKALSQGGGDPSRLSLVSEDDLEVQLGAKMLAAVVQREAGAVLVQLDRRIGWLAGVDALTPETNPVGPSHVAAAIYTGIRLCTVDPGAKLILFKLCERELPVSLEDFYHALNADLLSDGVLSQLQLIPPRRPLPKAVSKPATPDVESEADGAADDPLLQSARAPSSDEALTHERAVFDALHELLKGYRVVKHGAAADQLLARPAARPLSSSEVLSVVSVVQNEVPEGLRQAIQNPSASLVQEIKNALMTGAGRLGLDPGKTALDPVQEDAVDLVGMLFDVLLDEREIQTSARLLIGRLVLPFVKVALLDRRMFVQKTHPARRLLNALAEACEGNTGETPPEKALLTKVENVVDRLIAEFNEDLAIFQTLEEEFRAFLEQHRQRIEQAERRAVEAQRGRERLDQARARAALELNRRVGERQLPPTLDLILRRYWPHHLTMTLLREDENSGPFRASLALADELVTAYDLALGGTNLLPRLAGLRVGLESILGSSGCDGDAVGECLKTLGEELRRLARGEAQVESAATAAVASTAPPATSAEAPALRLVANRDALDYDPMDADRIRQLPIGTWLDFIDEEGKAQPAKFSWTSPISGRLMFVNRRGIRVCVSSAEELAEMMKKQRLKLRPANTAFERAMHQVLGTLKSTSAAAEPQRAMA